MTCIECRGYIRSRDSKLQKRLCWISDLHAQKKSLVHKQSLNHSLFQNFTKNTFSHNLLSVIGLFCFVFYAKCWIPETACLLKTSVPVTPDHPKNSLSTAFHVKNKAWWGLGMLDYYSGKGCYSSASSEFWENHKWDSFTWIAFRVLADDVDNWKHK